MPLRLVVGLGFAEHGYAKLSRGADAFITILHAIGMPFAGLLGWATIAVEIIGGPAHPLRRFRPGPRVADDHCPLGSDLHRASA